MTMFRYKAVGASGDLIEGELEAHDRATALRQLSATGRLPIDVRASAPAGSLLALLSSEIRWRPLANARAVSIWLHGLATLLDAGVAQDRAVELTVPLAQHQPFRRALERMAGRIRSGERLSAGVAAEAGLLSNADLALLRAGEDSGTVPASLKDLAAGLKRSAEFKDELRSALLYPAVLIVASIAVIALVVGVVVPAFETILAQTGAALPWATQLLLSVADAASSWGWIVLVAVVAAGAAIVVRARDPDHGAPAGRILLATPLFGPILVRVDITRCLRVLATLLRGGVSMERALNAVTETARNAWLRKRIAATAERVTAGERLSQAFEREVSPPRPTGDLLRIGEENGQMAEMLGFAAELLELQVRRRLSTLLAVLAPATTIIVGAIVAAIMIAVFSAILSLNEGILGR